MPGHASESYFIIGEGLLSVSAGGREADEDTGTAPAQGPSDAAAVAASGTAGVAFDDIDAPDAAEDELRAADAEATGTGAHGARAAEATAAAPPFRFSRMGPRGSQLNEQTRRRLGRAMTPDAQGPEGDVPAGYTYLGQFVDHDLTMDKTKVAFGRDRSPADLLQGRSPTLDLDCLYGGGPADPRSARFYRADGRRLKMGTAVADAGVPTLRGFDLPRGDGATRRQQQRAVIPDPRNDENLAVAQTHLAFIRFHNRVVETLPSSVPAAQRFRRARATVVKHYQWMIRHDYLPRICDAAVLDDVFANGRKVFEAGAEPTEMPTMPVEFSIGAFRLGHSMVREQYQWNRIFRDGAGGLEYLFQFSATGGDLGGRRRLAASWVADFRRLYDFGEAGRGDLTVRPGQFNRAMRIDTRLVNPLRSLPAGTFGRRTPPSDPALANLAFRNLTRARMVRLATGQGMVERLQDRGVAVTPLTPAQIRTGSGGADLGLLDATQRDAVMANTPLWFYVLREAELNGGRMTGVGARILAEVFHRAMEGSRFSIVRDTAFRPTLGPDDATFRMADLLLFAFEGKEELLAPVSA